jgi:hypothetical protein
VGTRWIQDHPRQIIPHLIRPRRQLRAYYRMLDCCSSQQHQNPVLEAFQAWAPFRFYSCLIFSTEHFGGDSFKPESTAPAEISYLSMHFPEDPSSFNFVAPEDTHCTDASSIAPKTAKPVSFFLEHLWLLIWPGGFPWVKWQDLTRRRWHQAGGFIRNHWECSSGTWDTAKAPRRAKTWENKPERSSLCWLQQGSSGACISVGGGEGGQGGRLWNVF